MELKAVAVELKQEEGGMRRRRGGGGGGNKELDFIQFFKKLSQVCF